MKDPDRQSVYDQFWLVFTFNRETEDFVSQDYEDIVFYTRQAAEEFAAKRICEDGESRAVVQCNAVAVVEVPAPVVRELKAADGLPPGIKPPPKPKNVIK